MELAAVECERVPDHPLTADLPSPIAIPHSGWNGVSEAALTDCRHQLLTRDSTPGVDTFIKREGSLFVYFQGHPEYEADTLLREYRRDIGRYCKGEMGRYPGMPQGHFDRRIVEALNAYQLRAISGQVEALPPEISAAPGNMRIENTWQSGDVSIYSDWLRYLRAQKETSVQSNNIISVQTAAQSLVTSV